jgi:Major royal jelly protein
MLTHLVIILVSIIPTAFSGSPFHRNWGGGARHADYSLPPDQSSNFNVADYRTTISAYNQTDIRAGEVFDTVYEWRILDFLYDTPAEHTAALASGDFVPENNLPLGVDQFGGRLFITTPRWKVGVPASLSVLPAYPPPGIKSPPLKPYPSWAYHTSVEQLDCSKLLSVYRIQVDECQRLWVLDAGVVETVTNLRQVCPPKIVVFDLNTDQPLFSYTLPADQVKEGSLHTNIVVDVRDGQCLDAFAYIFDVWRYGITVFSLRESTSWRTTNHLYFPNPLASDYTFAGLRFQWSDGAFGAALTEKNEFNDRLMFYHPMSSYMVRDDLTNNV